MEFSWGAAHDFSNLLQVIMGFAEFLKSQHKDNPDVMDCVNEILTASQRAKAMVADLIVVGRRNPPATQPVDVAPILRHAVDAITPKLVEGVTLELAVDSAAQSAILDPSSLERIVALLCAFAAAGMPEGGVITVRAARDGAQLRVSVHQAGDGLDAATVQRMCEPFYMKKHHHRGTGLELAVVAGLMDLQRGTMTVETAPGQGLTVHLSFPTG